MNILFMKGLEITWENTTFSTNVGPLRQCETSPSTVCQPAYYLQASPQFSFGVFYFLVLQTFLHTGTHDCTCM